MNLERKVIFITGCDRGIGRVLVRRFAEREALVGAGVMAKPRARWASERVLVLPCDVTDVDQARQAVEEVVAKWGRIDVLINNAGLYPRQEVRTMKPEQWRSILSVNLDGVWNCCRAVIPFMTKRRRGCIINVGSMAWRAGVPDLSHYHAAKAGVDGLTKGLARDLGRFKIRVNCLRLGAVQTAAEGEVARPAEVLKMVNRAQCLPGRMSPRSIEPVFAFFASDASGDITGQCLDVDRGWL